MMILSLPVISAYSEVGRSYKSYTLELRTQKGDYFPTAYSPADLKRPKIGIAFSGGGPVRGMVHLGVIQFLEEKGIKADYVAGTSIGSVVGSLYALGYSAQEIEDDLNNIGWAKMFIEGPNREQSLLNDYQQRDKYLINLEFSRYYELEAPAGVVQGHYVLSSLNRIVYKAALIRDFNDFKRPFRLNVVDLESSSEEVMSRGYLVDGLRASTSMPVVFDPFWIGDRIYVDGGLASNMQCDVVKRMGADIVIGINIPQQKFEKDQLSSLFNVAMQTITFNSAKRVEENKRIADVLIEPDIDQIGFFDFTKIDKAREEGRHAAEAAYPKLKALLEKVTAEADPIYSKLLELYASGDYSSVSAETVDGNVEYFLLKNPVLKELDFKKNAIFSSGKLKDIMGLSKEKNINTNRVSAGLNNVLALYHDNGYLLADIKEVNIKDGTVTVLLDEGVISEVTVEGIASYPNYYISEKFISLKGKVFDRNIVQGRLDEMYTQGYFKYLYYKVDDTSGGKVLTIVAKEKETNTLSAGARIDTDRGLGVLFGMNLVSLSGNKWTVGNQTILASNPSTNFNVAFFPVPLFSYLSVESNIFWGRISSYVDSNTVKTPFDVENYGANIKGNLHLTPWDNTSLGLTTRYLDAAFFMTDGAEKTIDNVGGLIFETQIDLEDKDVFPWGGYQLLYKANNMADQNEFVLDDEISIYINENNKISLGSTTGAMEKYYNFDKNFLLGGMSSLAGWKYESLLAMKFTIYHYKYSIRMFTDRNSILQNAYLNFFADTAILKDAINIDKNSSDVVGDSVVDGWGVGIEGESVLNLKTILNYEYSKDNQARIYFKIGNEF